MFCLYYCKDYCHRVTTQLQLIILIIIIIIIIIINTECIQSYFPRSIYTQSVMYSFYIISGVLGESEGAKLKQRACCWKRPLDSEIVVDRWCVSE